MFVMLISVNEYEYMTHVTNRGIENFEEENREMDNGG
jgi:hypothetical protein